jgi:nicotinate-nucleotide pyrophosphorylase (carboxylating)
MVKIKVDRKIRQRIKEELREDIGRGDITTRLLFPKGKSVSFLIRARAGGILSGIAIAREVFKLTDKKISTRAFKKDGACLKRDEVVLKGSGDARSVLAAERTAVNFLSRLSGIATLTGKFVDKVKPYRAVILDTRKTLPGLRELEKYAVRCGGGRNHRMGHGRDQVARRQAGLRSAVRRRQDGSRPGSAGRPVELLLYVQHLSRGYIG